jgi:predicted RNase H-like nuclease (RuvC/YqgF family)
MTTKTKVYLSIAGIVFLIICGYSLWSNHQITKLERAADEAKQKAAFQEDRANELDASARKYEEKIAYLEANLAELQSLARKQDEELKSIETNTGNARRDVERARRVRAAAATAEDVCRKLAELGHGCQ